jgi:hypothetical protein
MGEFSIKLKIAGSEYPLRISREDEEIVMKAASLINEQYAEFEKNYSHVREKKDVLAMCFLQIMVDQLKGVKGKDDELNRLKVFTQEVNSMIDEHKTKLSQPNS